MLYVVATPIGNLADITIRAIEILFAADIIACEDTRKTGLLVSELRKRYPSLISTVQKTPQLIAYHEHNEAQKTSELIALLTHGKNIALVSDGGTPLLSDPGYLLVQAAIQENISVVPIPGPSAFVTAASSAGLPTQPLLFLGFLPKSSGKRTKLLQSLHATPLQQTVSLFESPHRLIATLHDLQTVFGTMSVVVARGLTKIHEEIWRGTIDKALEHFAQPKGEFVILFQAKQLRK